MKPLFVRDKNGGVRGEMLFRVIDIVFDYIGTKHYAIGMIQSEIVTHDGYGVPRDLFPKFFDALGATMKEVLAGDWTPAMDASWNSLLSELRATAEAG
jgi:hypothetical protein